MNILRKVFLALLIIDSRDLKKKTQKTFFQRMSGPRSFRCCALLWIQILLKSDSLSVPPFFDSFNSTSKHSQERNVSSSLFPERKTVVPETMPKSSNPSDECKHGRCIYCRCLARNSPLLIEIQFSHSNSSSEEMP